ncbi:TIGR00341 family protein [Cyanobacterium stanieri LEGE 03274]|uniref:TIGR00341 family protein n=1 Tax=Cyanobacterium stanieri LEGE 03274 TaxID=1828756 RepID=A0ABR9V3Y2_9CHRO|nr:TIGR00341 family protein [Cyanobacterium stanieri]MBE9221524.1 TIGR00341 family protein [Cyanobacterium stanieri LEGE 03274]
MNQSNLRQQVQNFVAEWFNRKKVRALWRWLKLSVNRILPRVSATRIAKLHQELTSDSRWGVDYILCTIASCLIASFGLLSNSAAVIIGAMIVAPLMLPLRGLAFSACEGDYRLFEKSILSLVGATFLALLLSWFIAVVVALPDVGSEIVARTEPTLIDLGIAISAGLISGFGKVRSGISDTLAGTAIAVALMPPLCVVGISLASGLYGYATGAFLLYITNLLGITLACMVAFILSGYTKATKALGWASITTAFLVIPLGASFFQLIQQQQIEKEINRQLANETITVGQDVEAVKVGIIWTQKPPLINVTMQTDKEITPRQVELVRDYVSVRMNRDFELVFYIVPVKRVTREVEADFPVNNSNVFEDFDQNSNFSIPQGNNSPRFRVEGE